MFEHKINNAKGARKNMLPSIMREERKSIVEEDGQEQMDALVNPYLRKDHGHSPHPSVP